MLLGDAPLDLACDEAGVPPYARSIRSCPLDQREEPLGHRHTARSRTHVPRFRVRSRCLSSHISIRDIVAVNPAIQGRVVQLGVELYNSAKGVCDTTAGQPGVGG